MAKIVKNTTISDITVKDVGVTIPMSPGFYAIPPQEHQLWAGSVDIDSFVNAGTLVINDGYDDLKPHNGLLHIHEDLPRPQAYLALAQVQATTASLLILSASSRLLYMFTGTIANQIIKFPIATTLNIGHKYEIWNTSTQSIVIQNASASPIFVLAAFQKSWFTLQDNSTTAGIWLIEANFLGGSGGGNGCLNFGYNGTANQNRWLEVIGNNPSNGTPLVIAGPKAIRAFSMVSDSIGTYTVSLYKNGTIVDSITVTNAKKATKLNLNIILLDGDELSAQVTSGATSRPCFTLWL